MEPVDVGEAGEPAVVDGVRGEWRVDLTLLDAVRGPRRAPVAVRPAGPGPQAHGRFFIRLRARDSQPAPPAAGAAYALPVLHGDRLVGKVDATADHAAGSCGVHAVHEDVLRRLAVRADVADGSSRTRPLARPDLHLGAHARVLTARAAPCEDARDGPEVPRPCSSPPPSPRSAVRGSSGRACVSTAAGCGSARESWRSASTGSSRRCSLTRTSAASSPPTEGFVAGSLAWGMLVDGFRPDRYDVIGALVCLLGVAIIMYAPRSG